MIQKIRAFFRIITFGLVTMAYVTAFLLTKLVKGSKKERALRWRRHMLRNLRPVIGVEVVKEGTPYDGAAIFVSNHRSYFDPIVTLGDVIALPVAKAEVKKWPLIGFANQLVGILFVERKKPASRKATLLAMKQTLQAGHSVLIYPEGTTSGGRQMLELKKGAFRLAAESGFPVVPVALDYDDPREYWLGDDLFVPHFLARFGMRRKRIHTAYGPPIFSKDLEEIQQKTKIWINAKLLEFEQLKSN